MSCVLIIYRFLTILKTCDLDLDFQGKISFQTGKNICFDLQDKTGLEAEKLCVILSECNNF